VLRSIHPSSGIQDEAQPNHLIAPVHFGDNLTKDSQPDRFEPDSALCSVNTLIDRLQKQIKVVL